DFNDSPLSSPPLSQVVGAAPVAGAGCILVVDGAGPHTGEYSKIQAAVDVLPDPGPCTINVKAGTYNEQVSISNINGGSPAKTEANRIVIQRDPSAAV